jgi:hypothetical protein
MAETVRRKGRARSQAAASARSREADEAERRLGRAVALGLPGLCLMGAVTVGVGGGLASALLVLASGALLGAIALLWASVRTLSGDAPLSTEMERLAARGTAVDSLAERKRRVLRALKDLEGEHALGRIDDADYEVFVARYRDEAKAVMREMDTRVEPKREEAERIAREYLQKHGVVSPGEASVPVPDHVSPDASRVPCGGCGASNESDAAFCKGCGAPLKSTEKG